VAFCNANEHGNLIALKNGLDKRPSIIYNKVRKYGGAVIVYGGIAVQQTFIGLSETMQRMINTILI